MLTRLLQAAATLQSWQTGGRRHGTGGHRSHTHVHAFICSVQTHGRMLILARSVITCLSLGESSVLGQDWREASSPSRAQNVASVGPSSISGPDHKSQRFIFTPHCAQTHIFQAAYYAPFRAARARAPVVSASVPCLFCV